MILHAAVVHVCACETEGNPVQHGMKMLDNFTKFGYITEMGVVC